jgi:DNA-binding SARP family transcriptional activator
VERVEFRVLGPLEAREGDRVLPLGGARQRAVLAVLLTRANEVVSTDRLIDELWGETPPETAANVLQSYVSHLRKAIGSDLLLTRAPGYVMQIEADQLDLHRFERLVEEARALTDARPDEATRILREALALWRGPALADFAYEPFAQELIGRLEELRLVALERRIEADLAVGRHADLVGELEGLVTKHPVQERLRAHLMLALYRSGRQAEALAAYQAARRALVDELGIDPGSTLQELERSILRQDPALDLVSTKPAEARAERAQDGSRDPSFRGRSILVVPQDDSNLDALLALAEPLARRPPREVILARLVTDSSELGRANTLLQERRADLIARELGARAAAFTSEQAGEDAVRLASQQDVDLLLLDVSSAQLTEGVPGGDLGAVLTGAPCDVGVLVVRDRAAPALSADRPVLVPFGGADHDWAAAEIGAWLASAHGVSLRLLGVAGDPSQGRRDASRLLASAALMVQQFAGVATEPVLVEPGDEPVIEAAESAGLVVVGLSDAWRQQGLGATRLAVVKGARPPTLIVRGGLRPGGLAPEGSLTRFTWTLAGASQ